MKIIKTYKYRLFPKKSQVTLFNHTLDLCRELYNAALQERIEAYKRAKINISLYDQQNQLPAIKEVRQDLIAVHSQVLCDPLHRLDKAFKAFFARVKRGDKPGFPRFQGRNRYNSFCYPQSGWSLLTDKLTLSKIGTVKVKLHRSIEGKVKTVTIKREGEKWYVCFVVETEITVPEHKGQPVGIDVGLENFVNQSDGVQVENPRFFRKAQKHLKQVQQKYAKVKHLPRRDPKKVTLKKAITRCHAKVRNQRNDFHHKLSYQLTQKYNLIFVEDLRVKNLSTRPKPKEDENNPGVFLPNGASAKAGLNKSINDAGWATFISILSSKAVYAGSKVVEVDPKYTSQICPNCGSVAKKDLSERWHSCECGCEMHRDIAAALVILRRGLASQAIS